MITNKQHKVVLNFTDFFPFKLSILYQYTIKLLKTNIIYFSIKNDVYLYKKRTVYIRILIATFYFIHKFSHGMFCRFIKFLFNI